MYFTVFHFSARVSILKGGGYIYTKMCSNLLSCFQLQEVLADPKEQSRGLRAFTQLNKTPLCVQLTDRRCHQRRMGRQSPPRNSPDLDPGCLRSLFRHLQGTVNVSLMGPRDGHGDEHSVIHQTTVALLPFRYRYPLRHKDPAASSGRLTHNFGLQCNTAPFSPFRRGASLYVPSSGRIMHLKKRGGLHLPHVVEPD